MPTNDLAEGREPLLTEDTIIYTPRLYTFFMAILLTAIYEMKFRNYSLFQQVNLLAGGEVFRKECLSSESHCDAGRSPHFH